MYGVVRDSEALSPARTAAHTQHTHTTPSQRCSDSAPHWQPRPNPRRLWHPTHPSRQFMLFWAGALPLACSDTVDPQPRPLAEGGLLRSVDNAQRANRMFASRVQAGALQAHCPRGRAAPTRWHATMAIVRAGQPPRGSASAISNNEGH
eukprot:1254505-Prymnesium_polylepis.1